MKDAHDAIIFDCDGVLVNSELIAQGIELQTLASIGMRYPRDEYVRRFSGTAESTYRAELEEDARTRFGVIIEGDFLDRLDDAIDSAYEGRLKAIDGVYRLAAAWPGSKAVASSSSLRSVSTNRHEQRPSRSVVIPISERYCWAATPTAARSK